jgi:hypothetical protein
VDSSLKSFLLTPKDPHNFPAKTFALKVVVLISLFSGDCDANRDNDTQYFGSSDTHGSELDRSWFFTNLWTFQVREIEVFEITGSIVVRKNGNISIVVLLIKDTQKICQFSFLSASRCRGAKTRFKHRKLMMIKNDSNENPSERQKYPVNPAGLSLFPVFSTHDILDLDR